jgi:hypothetical protein
MTKEEKKKAKQIRISKHREKRNDKYRGRVRLASEIGAPLYAVTDYGVTGHWPDSNSPTGYSQKCSYKGICQYPCNGDC